MLQHPTRDLIRRIVLDYGFWDGYLDRPWETLEDPDPPELENDLEILRIDEWSLEGSFLQNPNLLTISLRRAGTLVPELGYDDECGNFLPWFLRWEELEYLARLAALRDPDLRHPGPLLTLLSRFTPLTTDAEVMIARPMLGGALAELSEGPPVDEPRFGPFVRHRLAYQVDHSDCRSRNSGYRWERVDGAWSLDDALSIRTTGSTFFPFAQWGAFMDDVVAEYHATAEPRWRAIAAAFGEDSRVELAGRLAAAGCTHPVILRGLRDPVDPAETLWLLELLNGEAPGTRLVELVSRLGPSARG